MALARTRQATAIHRAIGFLNTGERARCAQGSRCSGLGLPRKLDMCCPDVDAGPGWASRVAGRQLNSCCNVLVLLLLQGTCGGAASAAPEFHLPRAAAQHAALQGVSWQPWCRAADARMQGSGYEYAGLGWPGNTKLHSRLQCRLPQCMVPALERNLCTGSPHPPRVSVRTNPTPPHHTTPHRAHTAAAS